MNLEILAEGDGWIAVNKPAGVSVHNDPQDVLHLLAAQLKDKKYQQLHLAHRLDKETSGVLLLALTPACAKELAGIFEERDCKKIYHAVLRGGMPVSDSWQEWSWAISDKAEGRQNPQGLSKDRIDAKTRFKVINANKYLSLIEVELMTGRQHQIRKHAAIAKHAIIGDGRYNDPKFNKRMAEIYGTDRMFLHASRLDLSLDGKAISLEAPLPQEFVAIFKK
ncbi:RluA family pseudouridine synthase [Bdellovibrio sp. HCB2-146]|uniref:RluA family pseudouridine synthase n=1 Tax=Bdellovibrio sp. HCB2-146 TaxID=3394362 RepID=UPI0039BC93D7